MRPFLECLSDGADRTIAECRDWIADRLAISDEERSVLLPSGRVPLLNSRVHWAKTYLTKAGAVVSTARGSVRISDRGRELLQTKVGRITTADLAGVSPEFQAWRESSRTSSARARPTVNEDPSPTAMLGPEESLEINFQQYQDALQDELLEVVKGMRAESFERLVVDLLLRLGYGGTHGHGLQLGGTGDHGVDGVINQDKLGLDLLYVQAKRWEGSVGSPTVREFAGSLSAHRARKGVIITTSSFTRDARLDAERMGERIVLIDGKTLASLMYETGLGLTTYSTFELKRVDSDYFDGQ